MASVLRKLRVGLMVGAALLVAVIVGFVWYGRLMQLRFKLKLPKRLGANITQEADRFSYSQSSKGKTIFTVHAAKEIQRTDGTITLHDAGIELFGRQDGRSDRIQGQEFLFDQPHGVMTGVGEVFIDLAGPAGKGGKGDERDEARTIHVKTSGLVFDQKAQTAMTDQGIEFKVGDLTGTAVGAEYDAKSGVVVLRSAVHVSGLEQGHPVLLTAARAELQRAQNVALLERAKYTVLGGAAAESVAADHAQVHMTVDGEPREIDGQGHVALSAEDRGSMTGERMELALNEAGRPSSGRLEGGVQYAYDSEKKRAWGSAREVRVAFDVAGNPAHAVADGGVSFEERVPNQRRSLSAARVKLGFGAAIKGKTALQDADATGGASLRVAGVSEKGRTSTDVSGDELKARFVEVAGKDRITALDGMGHTLVHQVGADRSEDTSKGDTLAVSFKQNPSGGKNSGKAGGAAQIERAVQRGGVTIVRTAPPRIGADKSAAGSASAAQVEHASGDEAVYEADGDRLTLDGGAQVQDATRVLLANRVTMERGSGDATADGNVRMSYLAEDGKGEPLHILAARAVEKKAAGTADFFGVAGRDARMWQGGSQVEAPVLSFSENGKDKASRRMVAHGELAGDAEFVRAMLASAAPGGQMKANGEGAARNNAAPSRAPGRSAGRASGSSESHAGGGPVRIAGHAMTYVEAAGTVEFDGRVKVEGQSGVMTARKAVAYLADARQEGKGKREESATATGAGLGLIGGRVERVVATGVVEIEQPGRKGTGEQLVYTAGDQTFVLTGTKEMPPVVVDEARGKTTGATLRFRSGDDSVVISGEGPGQQKVRSVMQVKQ